MSRELLEDTILLPLYIWFVAFPLTVGSIIVSMVRSLFRK